jgi:hypothetical protein
VLGLGQLKGPIGPVFNVSIAVRIAKPISAPEIFPPPGLSELRLNQPLKFVRLEKVTIIINRDGKARVAKSNRTRQSRPRTLI